jgi:GT2 family glycosyltransferase
LMSRLPNNVVLYDRMDHHEGFAETGEAMMELERRLVEQADLVACTSQRIFEGTKQATDKCVLIRNAGEYEHFAERPAQLACESPRRVVGYFGAIAQWFDADLVAHAARERTDLDFVLVGETFGSDLGDLPELPNVTLIGEVGYDELPAYLHSFDVCMIPFKVVELTLSTNPVKVYEYLSAGKPVVSVPLPEVLAMGDVVGIGRDPQGFVRELDAALDEDSEEKREHRRAFARANTWENRGDDLHAAVAHCFPSVSVIVLAWNQLEFTRACLHSLEHFSDYPNWELIVVDNASTDGTVDFLLDYAEGRDHVRLVLNDENLGFAGGNNAGARAATGEYLVFLNNDTYVTSGWLGGMLAHFRAEPELGILNPVTNNIGNEARIEIHYADMTEMAAAADIYTRARRGQRIHLRSAAFFCAMLKRSTWLEVGGLDENFGVGFFEDDDYAMRLREKGFEIGCAEDVFVHHHLSATFDELGADRKREQGVLRVEVGAVGPASIPPTRLTAGAVRIRP